MRLLAFLCQILLRYDDFRIHQPYRTFYSNNTCKQCVKSNYTATVESMKLNDKDDERKFVEKFMSWLAL